MNLREEILLDLFTRMAEYIDHHGMDRDTALIAAAEDLKRDLRTTAQRETAAMAVRETANAFREAETTVH
jgi:hypothetical protein